MYVNCQFSAILPVTDANAVGATLLQMYTGMIRCEIHIVKHVGKFSKLLFSINTNRKKGEKILYPTGHTALLNIASTSLTLNQHYNDVISTLCDCRDDSAYTM